MIQPFSRFYADPLDRHLSSFAIWRRITKTCTTAASRTNSKILIFLILETTRIQSGSFSTISLCSIRQTMKKISARLAARIVWAFFRSPKRTSNLWKSILGRSTVQTLTPTNLSALVNWPADLFVISHNSLEVSKSCRSLFFTLPTAHKEQVQQTK